MLKLICDLCGEEVFRAPTTITFTNYEKNDNDLQLEVCTHCYEKVKNIVERIRIEETK